MSRAKSPSLGESPGGEAGLHVQTGGYHGGRHLVEWKSGRAPSMTHGTKLEDWVVRALSFYSPLEAWCMKFVHGVRGSGFLQPGLRPLLVQDLSHSLGPLTS